MPKVEFKTVEERWKKFWKENEIFKFKINPRKKIYSIDTPPPYISGNMHIGHAFSYSQQDFFARFKRMAGYNVFYPFGTDDNGLPTERFIEKKNKVKSREMGRTDFINLCLETLREVTPKHIQDFVDLGISSDYEIYYSTIDDHSRKISQESFIELFKKGEAYQKNFPTMWCSECQTSIAQAELEDLNEESFFSTLKFSCEGKDLLISTTRPELLGACVAVFVHPQDERYSNLVGKKAKIPLFHFEVPIIADSSANPEKGTGVLMVCSYGDRFDVDAINRHGLSSKVIIGTDGRINFGEYKGLKIKDARKKILEDLEKEGLVREKRKIEHVVNVHDKCGTAIEFIPTKQWFIKILDKKEKFLELGRKIKWYPDFMYKRYENWVKGLEWDWSISRNRHFGVPIPVWECPSCKKIILPSLKELPVDPLQEKKKCPNCGKEAEPEKMVLDTWATSSMTPQITSSLVKGRIEIPFSLRPQGHDIIRTWAFYTLVKAYIHEGKVPWNEIVVSGNVSLGGEKMSKSKGNVVDPKWIMENHGADALRFWAAGSKLGNDLDYQEKDLIAGKKIINKLVNASNFVFMNLKDYDGKKKPEELEPLDKLFLEELNRVIESSTKNFEAYEYSKVKQEIEQFFWSDFCDNYLEIVKKRVYQSPDGSNEKLSAQYTLYYSLLNILKIFAPIMPFITEEIYQEHFKIFERDESIHLSSWPSVSAILKSSSKLIGEDWEKFKTIISKVRQEKSKSQKPMNSEIVLTLKKEDVLFLDDLKNVTNAKEIEEGKGFNVEFID